MSRSQAKRNAHSWAESLVLAVFQQVEASPRCCLTGNRHLQLSIHSVHCRQTAWSQRPWLPWPSPTATNGGRRDAKNSKEEWCGNTWEAGCWVPFALCWEPEIKISNLTVVRDYGSKVGLKPICRKRPSAPNPEQESRSRQILHSDCCLKFKSSRLRQHCKDDLIGL